MAKWTNKYKIMEDLSVAQGSIVPASLNGAATYGDNSPPASGIIEETEEEYYKDGTGDGDFASGPDIYLIQEMLSLVRDHNNIISSDEDTDKVVVISKLNPICSNFVPNGTQTTKETPSKPKRKRDRNVALTSLLNNIEKQSEADNISLQKGALEDELNLQPAAVKECPMFRRKKTQKLKKPESQPILSNSVPQSRYVPSALAKDYYEKYLENSKKKVVQEDLWSRLERELKIIEERKTREVLISSPSTSSQASCDNATTLSSLSTDCSSALDKVCLPQQRHLLKAGLDCAVCKVFKKNVYDIKETL